jgi:hypothetical protein
VQQGGCAVTIWINRTLGTVDGREVRRVFRNQIGDWCAEVDMAGGWIYIAVFDHHPTIPSLRILRNGGTDIADDVIAQGAEGMDVRRPARPADDDR